MDWPHALQITDLLQSGQKVPNSTFDRIFPPKVRKFSTIHWTSMAVARTAVKHLVRGADTRVLDVGSGVGKFCMISALTTDARFTGVEQREPMVKFASGACLKLGITRASFIHGNMKDLDWTLFDAFYLFNPFYEHIEESIRIDPNVKMSRERYQDYVEIVRSKLRGLKAGTRVATFHGFGGRMPAGYSLMHTQAFGSGNLEVWIKSAGVRGPRG